MNVSAEYLAAFQNRRATLQAWSSQDKRLNSIAPETPTLYLFSGCDLLTPAAFRPLATAHNLLAEFSPGAPDCFVNATCHQVAVRSATDFIWHVGNQYHTQGGRPTITTTMQGFFEEVGVLPSLIATSALLDMRIVGAVSSKTRVTLYVRQRLVQNTSKDHLPSMRLPATWSCSKITYQGGTFVHGASPASPHRF